MAIDVLLIKEKGRLVAAEPMSAEMIDAIADGETLAAVLRRPRNPAHHRKLFALLSAVFENQNAYPTVQKLLKALKIATGLFETGLTVDGIPWVEPKSIAFASMCQAEFEQWYDRAIEVVLTRILPGLDRKDLEKRVNEILAGPRPVREAG